MEACVFNNLSTRFCVSVADFEQDGEENECDPDVLNDPVNQIDLQVSHVNISALWQGFCIRV